MRSTTPIHLPISMVRELPEFFSSPPRSIAQPQIRFITLDGLQPPYPPRSPSFASLLWADGASRMHVFVDPRPRYVGNTRVPWGRGKILPLSVPRLFRPLSSAMHCLQTSTRFVSLGYCSGEKMKFLPSGLFWWDFLWNGAGSLAFEDFLLRNYFSAYHDLCVLRIRVFVVFEFMIWCIQASLREGIWYLD